MGQKSMISRKKLKQSAVTYSFVLPDFIGLLIFIIIPVICSFGLSFAKWDLLNPIEFAGLENYREIFTEPLFGKILLNTIVFALSSSVLGVIIPLILAVLLNSKIRGSEFFKTAYFLPFITNDSYRNCMAMDI